MDSKARLFSSISGWPSLVDLKCGGALTLERKGKAWSVRLISVRAERASDWRNGSLPDNKMIREAKVLLEIDGRQCLLRMAPFEPPASFQGLRLHVETVKALNAVNALSKDDMPYDVRLSIAAENEAWAPIAFKFPVPGGRWRANPCYGAWGALLCGEGSRYSEFFNIGVSADACSVVAALPGQVKSISSVKGSGGLMSVSLEHLHGVKTVYCNLEPSSMPFSLKEGSAVDSGDLLGKASLSNVPPYLRFSLEIEGAKCDPYGALVESYLRESQDGVLPFAGGHLFCQPGDKVVLDSALSVLRPGKSVKAVSWKLSSGAVQESSRVEMVYSTPGFHAEELRLLLDDGQEYRDAVHVRVFKPGVKGQPGFPGWLSHSPSGEIVPNAEIEFRLMPQDGFKVETVDFGDGSAKSSPEPVLKHSYGKPGVYTVEAKGQGPDGAPMTLKRFVTVRA